MTFFDDDNELPQAEDLLYNKFPTFSVQSCNLATITRFDMFIQILFNSSRLILIVLSWARKQGAVFRYFLHYVAPNRHHVWRLSLTISFAR